MEDIEKTKELVKDIIEEKEWLMNDWKCILSIKHEKAIETLLQYIEELEQENKNYKEFIITAIGKNNKNITTTRYMKIRQKEDIQDKIKEQTNLLKRIDKLSKMMNRTIDKYNAKYNLKKFL